MRQGDLLQVQLSTESGSRTEGKEHQRKGALTRVAFAQLRAFSGELKMSHPGSREPGWTCQWELWSLQLG